jgi:hypothetical protein
MYSLWFYPLTDSAEDIGATERAKQFMYGWYVMLYCISHCVTVERIKKKPLYSAKGKIARKIKDLTN